jgi:hypothetical protein
MNAGTRIAGAEWLLFLHADTVLPDTALESIAAQSAHADGSWEFCWHTARVALSSIASASMSVAEQ